MRHAVRQAPWTSRSLRLDAVDDVQRVLAEPHHDDAADDLAAAVELRHAAADVGPELHAATSRTRTGVPRGSAPSDTSRCPRST